jgi:hypothetical protein
MKNKLVIVYLFIDRGEVQLYYEPIGYEFEAEPHVIRKYMN